MPAPAQDRTALAPALHQGDTPAAAPAQGLDSAFAKGAQEAMAGVKAPAGPVEKLLSPSEGASDDVQRAQETVRALDDGSFRGIASAENIAALEIAKRVVSEGQTRVQRMQELAMPTKTVEGYRATDLIKRLINDMVLNSQAQLLTSRRSVGARSARDSIHWLLKGVTALSDMAATLLGRTAGAGASQSDRGEQGAKALSMQAPELDEGLSLAARELHESREPAEDRPERIGLRLLPEDDQ